MCPRRIFIMFSCRILIMCPVRILDNQYPAEYYGWTEGWHVGVDNNSESSDRRKGMRRPAEYT